MLDGRRHHGLTLEQLTESKIYAKPWRDHLQRNRAVKPKLECAKHNAHPSVSQQGLDPVAGEYVAWAKLVYAHRQTGPSALGVMRYILLDRRDRPRLRLAGSSHS